MTVTANSVLVDVTVSPPVALHLQVLPPAPLKLSVAGPVVLSTVLVDSQHGPTGPIGATGAQGVQGVQGLTGPAPASTNYQHSQGVSTDTWVVAHNLGFKPNVSIFDSAGTNVIGDISHVDYNTLRLTFQFAFGGYAVLS